MSRTLDAALKPVSPRPLRQALALACAAALSAACAGQGWGPGGPSGSRIQSEATPGVYAFEAPVPSSSGQILLEGTFEVTPDTVILLLERAECRPGLGSSTGFAYNCQGAGYPNVSRMSFGFERAQPLRQPHASVTVSVPSTREFCHRWLETERGRSCMSWGNETTYRTERQSVRLKVTRQETAKEAISP